MKDNLGNGDMEELDKISKTTLRKHGKQDCMQEENIAEGGNEKFKMRQK